MKALRCSRWVGHDCPNPPTLIGLPWPTPLCEKCAVGWCDGPNPLGQKSVRPMTETELALTKLADGRLLGHRRGRE